MYASNFLQGRNTYTAATIIDLWFRGPDGRVTLADSNHIAMYATSPEYTSIKPARAALSAFAVQLVISKARREAKSAVLSKSGLHATTKKRGTQKIQWADVGDTTVSRVKDIIKAHSPIGWEVIHAIAGNESHDRKRRPLDMVCTHVMSSLLFSRNNEARLLPLVQGLLYFAHSAPADLIAYGSRIGAMPAYTTISKSLRGLADHQAQITKEVARDPTKSGFTQFDNVQNYLRQQDHRLGRVNQMNIGVSGTFCEVEGVDLTAGDLDDRRQRLLENKRADLTVEQLLAFIDHQHTRTVFSLHWLQTLISAVPELSKWQKHVTMLFETKATKIQLPSKATKVHPLASISKNETVTTELKDIIIDICQQLGISEGDYDRRLIFVGGDGLTFQKVVELKKYLQFHKDPFQSFEIIEPVLALWHTEWTDLSRIFEVHWDGLMSKDPSSLGHSASCINRPAPSNLKKVDYYPAAELMYLFLEARMLDCWRLYFKCDDIFLYFEGLATSDSLPDIEDLVRAAERLHSSYSTTRAAHLALDDLSSPTPWAEFVPSGSRWIPPIVHSSSQEDTETSHKPSSKKQLRKASQPDSDRHKNGDRVLSNSILFMRDALVSREMAYAHTKYSGYLLETICRLELESSPALRETILRTTLINLMGKPGGFTAADLMQEYFNRLLEAIVEKKGVEYGDTFIREVISRNLHHFARIKLDTRLGVGLTKRSGNHSAPHQNPEMRILLNTYRDSELHLRRPGRFIQDVDKDNFQDGLRKLRESKLKKWVGDTTSTRNLLAGLASSAAMLDGGNVNLVDEDDEDDTLADRPSLGFGYIVDGELVIGPMSVHEMELEEYVSRLEDQVEISTDIESDDAVDSDDAD
ncbi:hypothetical protein NLJ89_g10801 [Agrocybe chaxingu]|uniref:DUF6589 domain-containing protein n=1 Tax=Agrocybe chaxingu TaxID=84603 RepID=A0A9W8JXH1_9AGAR|nr:hypothetical protein NLJ89_g10801 [Agrocybe chaxingu]